MYTESDNLQDYLKKSEVIDFDNRLIVDKCLELQKSTGDEISLIKKVYEFVRDEIHHTGDIEEMSVTCKASEVLEAGHGICCAKAHLFAAMLRYFGVPAGFCYQKLSSSRDINIKFLHGLNAVYLKDLDKWIRLDARGNKPGRDAQFSIYEEKISKKVNKELGEEDSPVIFAEPNPTVIEILKTSKDMKELWDQWDLGLKDLFKT
ncbi:MAG: transglutaminase family protein [Methanosarcina vacuolata]|jgi:transglutaminase-like putative cysteine protease|nr:transglutaminase family protein [Methanosarcina vacuolata]